MKRLKDLKVDMVVFSPEVDKRYEDYLFSPLKTVRGLQSFEVCVSWDAPAHVEEESTDVVQPFVLKEVWIT